MNRTVVITGAGGFVGSHMAEGFLAMGDRVLALDSHFDVVTRYRLGAAELIEQPLDVKVLPAGFPVDLVIHGAAITTPPHDLALSDADHIQANVDLVLTGLDIALSHCATDFVLLSSSGVFAAEDGNEVHLENTKPTASLPYAIAKIVGEQATQAANGNSLRAISVRLGPIYGPHEIARNTRTMVSQVRRWLHCIAANEPMLVQMPDERRDWTFAPDLPRALDALLRQYSNMTGAVHLTSAAIVSNLELARAIAALVDNARIVVEPSGVVPRLPMVSHRVDLARLCNWTSLQTGLMHTLAEEMPA